LGLAAAGAGGCATATTLTLRTTHVARLLVASLLAALLINSFALLAAGLSRLTTLLTLLATGALTLLAHLSVAGLAALGPLSVLAGLPAFLSGSALLATLLTLLALLTLLTLIVLGHFTILATSGTDAGGTTAAALFDRLHFTQKFRVEIGDRLAEHRVEAGERILIDFLAHIDLRLDHLVLRRRRRGRAGDASRSGRTNPRGRRGDHGSGCFQRVHFGLVLGDRSAAALSVGLELFDHRLVGRRIRFDRAQIPLDLAERFFADTQALFGRGEVLVRPGKNGGHRTKGHQKGGENRDKEAIGFHDWITLQTERRSAIAENSNAKPKIRKKRPEMAKSAKIRTHSAVNLIKTPPGRPRGHPRHWFISLSFEPLAPAHRLLTMPYFHGLIFRMRNFQTAFPPTSLLVRVIMLLGTLVAFTSAQDPGTQNGLKVVPEFDQILDKADQLAKDGRFDLASTLWQEVIDKSQGAVITRSAWNMKGGDNTYVLFRPARREIERVLSGLSPEALRAYRLRADAEARILLAEVDEEPANREAALAGVASRYFLSTLGDDCAIELAGIHLDRFEFLAASRLLEKALTLYPDSDTDLPRAWLQYAVASARAGNPAQVERALAEATTLGVSADLIDSVKEDSERNAGNLVLTGDNARDDRPLWPQWLGGPARNRIMPDLAIPPEAWRHTYGDAADANPLKPIWTWHFDDSEEAEVEPDMSDGELRSNWDSFGWQPTLQLRFAGDALFLKTQRRTMKLAQADAEIQWPSVASAFAPGQASRRVMAYGRRNGGSSSAAPIKSDEVQLFGDHVQSDLTIQGDHVYTLDGPGTSVAVATPMQDIQPQWRGFGRPGRAVQVDTNRARANRLTAYHRTSGKTLWFRWVDQERQEKSGAGFMSAPVPYGDLLLAPVANENHLWLYALSAKDGSTVWKSYLCEDNNTSPSRFSTVTLAVDGGEVYVSTGAGAVIALNTISGELRWAVAYTRSEEKHIRHTAFMDPYHRLKGWSRDTIVLGEQQLVVMPSDYTAMVCLDRATGEHQWEAKQTAKENDEPRSAAYSLGVTGGKLFVAGGNVLRRYGLDGGKFEWSVSPENSYGRGLLTKDLVFLPQDKRVLVYKTDATFRERRPFYFTPTLPHKDENVGNLFSDGERLYIVGTRCVSAYDASSFVAAEEDEDSE